jgi:hypothetical protein
VTFVFGGQGVSEPPCGRGSGFLAPSPPRIGTRRDCDSIFEFDP